MVAPKFPRTGVVILAVLAGAVVLLIVECLTGWQWSRMILGMGLIFDIGGAFILAIPDIPSVHRRFFSGKLKGALKHLSMDQDHLHTRHMVEPGTSGQLEKRVVKFDPERYRNSNKPTVDKWIDDASMFVVADPSGGHDGFYEFVKAFEESSRKFDSSNVFGVLSYREGTNIKYTFMKLKNENMTSVGPFNYELAIAPLEDKVDELEARFRRLGIALLITGFLLQGLSVILS